MIRLLLLSFILLIVSGCAADIEQPALEDYGMVMVFGFDYVDEEKMKVTVVIPQPSKEAEKKDQVFSSIASMYPEGVMDISTKSDRSLKLSQLRVVLFSEELAQERSITPIIEGLYRDPIVGDRVYIGIVKGSTEEMLNKEYPEQPQLGTFFNNLLHPRLATSFHPFTTIHDFMYSLTNNVSDPMLPYLEQTKNSAKISKIALFKGGQMIDTMSPEGAKVISALEKKKTRLPNMKLTIEEESGTADIVLSFVRTTSHVESNCNLERPAITVSLDLKTSVVGYNGEKDLELEKEEKVIEKEINKEIKQMITKGINRFQELGIDPLRLGEKFRKCTSNDQWTKEKWIESFATAKINVKVHTDIATTGVIY